MLDFRWDFVGFHGGFRWEFHGTEWDVLDFMGLYGIIWDR